MKCQSALRGLAYFSKIKGGEKDARLLNTLEWLHKVVLKKEIKKFFSKTFRFVPLRCVLVM